MKYRKFESRATIATTKLVSGARSLSNLNRIKDGSVLCAMLDGISYRLVKYGERLMCFRASDSHPVRCTLNTNKVQIGTKKVNKKYVTKYKKIFTKKNAGKKAKVNR